VEYAVHAAAEDFGDLDIALNNAGYDGEFQLTQDYSTEMLALNVRGVFLSMKHELRQMISQRSWAIVNMSPGAGVVGVRGFSGYTATKAAEIAMTKSSAFDVAPYGIRINAVMPRSGGNADDRVTGPDRGAREVDSRLPPRRADHRRQRDR
jgi:NAD(P)-dependent dehydrogenase (short-subunit alcohol dehydrogenase family)